ncbi:ribose-phosphate pyrophosphokinase [Candidatus Bipolaricaulota bacterium]|nr:ribose-phosphate pyrophosphokinase [Candidatus Bipolaricaulota bacterium]
MKLQDLKIIAGNSNPELAQEIVSSLSKELTEASVDKFPDGEIHVHVQETVRGASVFVVQSVSPPVNDNLVELLLIIDALKRASAKQIAAVIPYYGYARQDRKQTGRVPISAKLVANIISTAGADRILTVDLHAGQIQGFFDIPVDNLRADPVLADTLKDEISYEEGVVVSPDVGGAKRARKVSQKLNMSLAIVEKKRGSQGEGVEVLNLIGNVESKRCLMVDDIVSTAGTLTEVAEILEERGAKHIEAICTHGIFAGGALESIEKSPIDSVTVTNTIHSPEAEKADFINHISVGDLFARTIKRIYQEKSVSTLFPHS